MKEDWKPQALGNVLEIVSGQVDPQKEPYRGMPHVGGDNIEADTGRIVGVKTATELGLESGKYLFNSHHVLYSKIRPRLNKVALPAFGGICSADIYPLQPRVGVLSREYLAHLLRSHDFLAYTEKHSSRTNIPKLNRESLLGYETVLPPLREQRRIASILDQADALRAKRRAALAQLDTLTQSVFLDLFGDQLANSKHWPVTHLGELLAMPLRNGLSPSSGGSQSARVLTLSAVTGDAFQADAWKDAPFRAAPPKDQRVCAEDLLVCRGNGNAHLVGKGHFPPHDMPDTTFPDTMIAVRVSRDRLDRTFLGALWNGPAVRQQIESVARTTNGTFKINQTMLEDVRLITPPLMLQEVFAAQVAAIGHLRSSYCASLTHVDRLFASLQHRAFRGEL